MTGIPFAVIAANGAVVAAGACAPDDLPFQASGGQMAMEISAAELEALRASLTGWRLVNGDLVHQPPAPPLAALQADALAAVDAAAEAARQRFITPGAGQALTYQQKEAEARRFTPPGTTADYPFLAAEQAAQASVGLAVTLAEVATLTLAQADAWIAAGSEIERLRRGAKLAIAAATTAEAVRTAAAVTWPVP
ncbi:hypothetical protein [Paracraurococcus ruber]|uniref:DUF4376 domain-containing protein n=1 Tax=Paracraurococcus ruber TaxID=77675 RepID=A0ABS1CRC9_9PROT|nr:hypothetical protein [Paracraurococcus ruber]MBK1656836.1 hypothetical protein [Paracraurococcus ruber]TDG33951.1 hypothetical protein E2C05_01540 [Paracraurococcus ruber]